MRIDTLGCAGAIAPFARTSTFLLDDDTLIDAGSGVLDLPLRAQQRIGRVFLTHAHFDHLCGLPLLADSIARYRMARGLGPIVVQALPSVLDDLRRHIFNHHIWPDFTVLPEGAPALRLEPLQQGDVIALGGGRQVEALPAVHSVPTVGYAVLQRGQAWLYTGDTGRNPALWQRINQMQRAGIAVRHLVIETTFASVDEDFATLTGHLTPASLAQELLALDHGGFVIHLTHLKPCDRAAIAAELDALEAAAHARGCTVRLLHGSVADPHTWSI